MTMIPNCIGFWIGWCVLIYHDIGLVQAADECVTREDCPYHLLKKCCRTRETMERRCTFSTPLGNCLGEFCLTESDCNDPKDSCCRSNKCINKGCSGCSKDEDCYKEYVCCKTTFPFAQTVCGANCLNQLCQWNNDCSGENNECCRSGKCVKTGCSDRCQSNSECFMGEYCCKRSTTGRSCRQSCVGEICSLDDDCGGPNECCISKKCVTVGCTGCNTNLDCADGHYCCGGNNSDLGRCNSDCVGTACTTDDDCGDKICGSQKVCEIPQTSQPSKSLQDSSSPPWRTPVIVVCIALFLIVLALVVFKYYKRRRTGNATQVHRGTVSLQIAPKQQTPLPSLPYTKEISGFNNPIKHEGSEYQNQPPHIDRNSDEFHEPNYEPLVFRNEEQQPHYHYEGFNDPNVAQSSSCQANENLRYVNFPQNNQGKSDPISADLTQHDNEGYIIPSPPQSPISHTTHPYM